MRMGGQGRRKMEGREKGREGNVRRREIGGERQEGRVGGQDGVETEWT